MKTDKELATEIVIAAINAGIEVVDDKNKMPVKLDSENIPALIEKIYSALRSLDSANPE